jgi:hypothetical protein
MIGLCQAASLLTAQNQPVKSETSSAEKRLETANELQKQLERIKAELTSVRQQLRDPSNPEANAILTARVDALEKRAERMGTDLGSIKAALPIPAVGKPLNADSFTGARFVQVQPRKGLSVELTNGLGDFTTGPNSFCIDFRNIWDGGMADVGEVQTDFTQTIRHVKAIRAVARLDQTEMGRYCGNVSLPVSGTWLVTAKYAGPAGKGKALFAPVVK